MPENISRRQLLKAIGFTGAGLTLGVAGILSNPFASSAAEETASSGAKPLPNRYWWVKDVDVPTMEIDWKNVKRFSEWKTVRGSLRTYRGAEED